MTDSNLAAFVTAMYQAAIEQVQAGNLYAALDRHADAGDLIRAERERRETSPQEGKAAA